MNNYIKYSEKEKGQYYDLSTDKLAFMKDTDKVKVLKDIVLDVLNLTETDSDDEYIVSEVHRELYEYLQYRGK